MADVLRATINSTSPLGILLNTITVAKLGGLLPPLPPSLAWMSTNFFVQVLFLTIGLYKGGVVGDNITMAMMIAAAVVAGLNVLNNQPVLGDMSFGGMKLPGM